MVEQASYERAEIDSADDDSPAIPGVVTKTILRDEFRTRNVKLTFGVLLAVALVGAALWVTRQSFSGDFAWDLGLTVGYMAMAGFSGFVVAVVLTVLAKSAYLGGHRLLAPSHR